MSIQNQSPEHFPTSIISFKKWPKSFSFLYCLTQNGDNNDLSTVPAHFFATIKANN